MRKHGHSVRVLKRRIRVHDPEQFELKLEYLPGPDETKSRYALEAWVCVPAALNVGPDLVPTEALYADIHNYVRLKTPVMSFPELAALPHSPLVRLLQEARRAAAGADPALFAYECKLFACVYRATLRELVERAETIVDRQEDADQAYPRLAEVLDAAAGVLAQFRGAAAIVEVDRFPERGRAAFRLVDEYTSVLTEQTIRRAIVVLRSARGKREVRRRLLDRILAEEGYRRARGYGSVLDPGSDNEGYVYRSGVLKKYCSSVLFLQIRRLAARRHWQELFFAVAAGIAMAFATAIAFFAQARYGQIGLRVFVILVVAYMFKDRLKEGARTVLAANLSRWLYDRKIAIEDPAGGTLGQCQEKMEYVAASRVPPEIRALRLERSEPTLRRAEEELRETIYRYRKVMTLDAVKLRGRRGGSGVTDIVRFHVGRLLHEMDEPDQRITWVDRESLDLGSIRGHKVYHVDVVFRFSGARGEPPTTTLARLIIDKTGIVRIERR